MNTSFNINRPVNSDWAMKLNIDDYPVVVSQKVAWGDMDAYAHVNNAVYFRYFETGRMVYFERVGILSYRDETNIGPILASTSCDFLAPLTYPDDIKILTRINEIKEKRFNIQSVIYSETLDKIVAQGNGMIVYYDYTRNITCHIPARISRSINKLECA